MTGVSPRGHEQGGYRRTNLGSPADWELTKARKAHRCTSSAHYVSGGEYCGGREIASREIYVRVRAGNWMEFDPMHVECAIAAGYVELVHECDSGDFDRSICPTPCRAMHSYCDTCGTRQDPCAHENTEAAR